MASFNEVSSFINKYLSSNGKSVEAITSYVRLDAKKIEREKDKILDFIANNIYFMHVDGCPLINLTKDLEGNTWNNVATAIEYDVFEQLIALCFEVGLLEDDLAIRFSLSNILGREGGEYLEGYIANYRDFLDAINNKVLPYYSFRFNSALLAKFMTPLEVDEDEIKQLIIRWFCYTAQGYYSFDDLDYFNSILDKHFDDVLTFVLYEYIKGKSSHDTIRLCKAKKFDDVIVVHAVTLKNLYEQMPAERRNTYDEEMKIIRETFFKQVSLTFGEYSGGKRRKYE